ncbi:MAG TPA: cation acetate symporter [Pseudonocardiaceae bacterium]
MDLNPWAIATIAVVAAVTFYLGFHSSRLANTTPDFLLARRLVRSRRNAAALAGDYLSASSFLGIAGLIMQSGVDALWYSVGCVAGYLALLLFVAAPLRRSGAYTLPDFAEIRLGSMGLRRLCTAFTVFLVAFYLLPQLQGAGLTLATVMPVPSWLGEAVVVVLVTINVLGGGMRAVTVVQAFQYWVKLFAIAAPTFVLIAVIAQGNVPSTSVSAPPMFSRDTTVSVHTTVELSAGAPVRVRAHGTVDDAAVDGTTFFWPANTSHTVDAGTTLDFPAGTVVPVVTGEARDNGPWLTPESGGTTGLLGTYSMLIALCLGAMGLPHVLVRFYTNPSGRSARRSTLHVLLLLGLFYLFPTILGAMSRLYVPELLVTGQTNASILLLPQKLLPGAAGQILGAILVAGAFTAFLSTSSGLLTAVAGVLSTDLLPGRVRDFRWATVLSCLVPMALAIVLPAENLALTIGLAFTLAASTFGPVLLAGIWWRGLTWVGAAAGIVVGGGLVIAALVLNVISQFTGRWAPPLLVQPALITVPTAFLVVFLVSKATARHRPRDVNRLLLRMHAPDTLGFFQDRDGTEPDSGPDPGDRPNLANGKHSRST